ncbi:MAG: type II toxin-antitoxin system Phd/YefM family antitoxin [Treponema sp.]|nr:type II toxin-antitoxin system Phd/YefM family antitoxin [Candidatus Treponema equi]
MLNPVPIYEAKNKLTFFIHQAEQSGPVMLTRHGKEVAVIVSIDKFNELQRKAKDGKKAKSIVERAYEFRENYGNLYTNEDIDNIFGNTRDNSTIGFLDETKIWDDVIEDK